MNEIVAGIDEAGRGPLAGPVVAAAVILDSSKPIVGLADSKKLSEKKRELLFDVIIRQALSYGIGFASSIEIDTLNILQATFLAMRRAVEQLKIQPTLALVDGNQDPGLSCRTETIVQGDCTISAISAASILAKVTRDHWMQKLHEQYPAYGFAKHKGYPTNLHRDAIMRFGVISEHRRSFRLSR